MFESFIDPVLSPLFISNPFFSKNPILIVIIIAFVVSALITFIYKLMTNQDVMKRLKSELKEFQGEMKELKDHPEKVMKIQQKTMKTNMKYMGLSMKPTLITFIPIIIIFGWLSAHLAFAPLIPEQEFVVSVNFKDAQTDSLIRLNTPDYLTIVSNPTQKIIDDYSSWTVKGPEGEYLLEYSFMDEKFSQEVIITNELAYSPTIKKIDHKIIKSLKIHNNKLIVMNLFGWKLGWLGAYIIFSLVFSMGLRKLLKLA